MKNFAKSFFVIVALVFMFILTGCEKNKNTLTGNWYYYDGTSLRDSIYYTFNEDKTGGYTFSGSTNKFTYEDNGKTLTISYENANVPNEFDYTIENGTLTIKDSFGEDVVYKKK